MLRARWRTASLASGWRFPGDWDIPEVDTACVAVLTAHDTGDHAGAESSVAALAGARAHAGAGLSETLGDVAALHAVLADGSDGFVAPDVDAVPARLVRLAALGWADVSMAAIAHAGVSDSLTGLPTLPYLRTRLGEVYRGVAGAGVPGENPAEQRLVSVRLDSADVAGWQRVPGMVIVADVLRTVFCNGESLAALGATSVAALAPDSGRLPRAVQRLHHELHKRLRGDRALTAAGAPRVAVTPLPATYEDACTLLDELAGGTGPD